MNFAVSMKVNKAHSRSTNPHFIWQFCLLCNSIRLFFNPIFVSHKPKRKQPEENRIQTGKLMLSIKMDMSV